MTASEAVARIVRAGVTGASVLSRFIPMVSKRQHHLQYLSAVECQAWLAAWSLDTRDAELFACGRWLAVIGGK